MRLVISPMGIVDREHPGQGVMDIVNASFEDMLLDTSICCQQNELEEIDKIKQKEKAKVLVADNPQKMGRELQPLLEHAKKEDIHFSIGQAPSLPYNTKHVEKKEKLTQLVNESITCCGKAGCEAIIIKPWFAGIETEDAWEINRAYYLQFVHLAKENHVKILIQNTCKDIKGHLNRGICSDAVQAALWVDKLNQEAGEERFGFCLDVGVCNICGQNMYDVINILGHRTEAVIVRDCNGQSDTALLPFTSVNQGQSQTDWLNLFRGLREVGFDGQLILNLSDTAASFSPMIRPALLQLAKSVADYLVWQIGIENLLKKYPEKVLFGAGNMCRNYMKCYGEKYPPLFTCDNNSALWGTSFCGLEVKSPESLTELPKNCAVFLCNIYYREIEKQIRDMGIKNPIVFFNDEYMPSFYFNRLEEERR